MEIIKDALAGTLESSDVMVRIGPCDEPGIHLELESLVKQQFGNAIERVTRETLAKLGVERAHVVIDDKGALECVLRARVQAAVMRAAEQAESFSRRETASSRSNMTASAPSTFLNAVKSFSRNISAPSALSSICS